MIRLTGVTAMRLAHQNLSKVQSIFYSLSPSYEIFQCPKDNEDFPTIKFNHEDPLFEYKTPSPIISKRREGVLGTDFLI